MGKAKKPKRPKIETPKVVERDMDKEARDAAASAASKANEEAAQERKLRKKNNLMATAAQARVSTGKAMTQGGGAKGGKSTLGG